MGAEHHQGALVEAHGGEADAMRLEMAMGAPRRHHLSIHTELPLQRPGGRRTLEEGHTLQQQRPARPRLQLKDESIALRPTAGEQCPAGAAAGTGQGPLQITPGTGAGAGHHVGGAVEKHAVRPFEAVVHQRARGPGEARAGTGAGTGRRGGGPGDGPQREQQGQRSRGRPAAGAVAQPTARIPSTVTGHVAAPFALPTRAPRPGLTVPAAPPSANGPEAESSGWAGHSTPRAAHGPKAVSRDRRPGRALFNRPAAPTPAGTPAGRVDRARPESGSARCRPCVKARSAD